MSEKREKVVVAMSGGVDSSVAACLLIEQGYDVVGLFMRTGVSEPEKKEQEIEGSSDRGDEKSAREHKGCCSASDAADARFVAGLLDVPFYVLNFEKDFDRLIDYFADEYARGRTPNPCVVCNDELKFGRIVEYADAVGAKYIATGHYARIEKRDGHNVMMRGVDENKDQSYVLFGLEREILDRLLFPIGHLTKPEVRRIAEKYKLPNQDKPDSVDICFVPDRDYARVVRERRPDAFSEGEVVDQDGKVVGTHGGIANYTIGQRRGLGIAAGTPIYVTQLDVLNNRVTIGDDDALFADALIAGRVNFLTEVPGDSFRATVKIRYLHKPTPATVELLPASDQRPAEAPDATSAGNGMAGRSTPPEGGMAKRSAAMSSPPTQIRVIFDEPQRAITPGQAVVFYDGDIVMGGAWIERVESTVPALAGSEQ